MEKDRRKRDPAYRDGKESTRVRVRAIMDRDNGSITGQTELSKMILFENRK